MDRLRGHGHRHWKGPHSYLPEKTVPMLLMFMCHFFPWYFADSLSWKAFIVLHLFVHVKSHRNSCIKNEKQELEREGQTVAWLLVCWFCKFWTQHTESTEKHRIWPLCQWKFILLLQSEPQLMLTTAISFSCLFVQKHCLAVDVC